MSSVSPVSVSVTCVVAPATTDTVVASNASVNARGTISTGSTADTTSTLLEAPTTPAVSDPGLASNAASSVKAAVVVDALNTSVAAGENPTLVPS